MLNIEHLTKTYGEKKAVDDLNLHIRPGQDHDAEIRGGHFAV